MNARELEAFKRGGAEALAREAQRQVEQRRRADAHRRTKRGRAPGKSKDDRRAEHRASTGELRADAAKRSEGKCEVSGVELGASWELHHLRGGGERRSAQSLDNCLAVSWDVHRLIHRGDLATLRDVKAACIRLGMRDGLQAIGHRIEKIEAVRGVF